MSFDLDFTGETFQQVDQSAGHLPNGFYRARVEKTFIDTQANMAQKLVFLVTHGQHTGRKMIESLQNPRFVTDIEKAKTAMNRAKLFAVRLGVANPALQGQRGAVDFNLAIGRDVVIKVRSRTYKKADGSDGEATGLDFAGIYQLDSADIPAQIRADLGLMAAAPRSDQDGAAGASNPTPTPSPTKPLANAVSGLWGAGS